MQHKKHKADIADTGLFAGINPSMGILANPLFSKAKAVISHGRIGACGKQVQRHCAAQANKMVKQRGQIRLI